jgi:hypothetical protein
MFISLSPSPVLDAFPGILNDEQDWLLKQLCSSEKSLLRAAEANVIEYTLAAQNDGELYANILLQVLAEQQPGVVSRISLDEPLSPEQVLQVRSDDQPGVFMHYVMSKLCEVVLSLSTSSRRVTIASIFYPNGILRDVQPLVRILEAYDDAFLGRGAALALSYILLEGRKLQLVYPEATLVFLLKWMTSQLKSSKTTLSVVTPSLNVLLVDSYARDLFDAEGGLHTLSKRMKHSSISVQQTYELVYCLWLFSFDCNRNERIRNHFAWTVPLLTNLVAAGKREKIIRLAMSCLVNLATCREDDDTCTVRDELRTNRVTNGQTFLHEMVGCGLIKSIDLMKEREWNDPDLAGGKKIHST